MLSVDQLRYIKSKGVAKDIRLLERGIVGFRKRVKVAQIRESVEVLCGFVLLWKIGSLRKVVWSTSPPPVMRLVPQTNIKGILFKPVFAQCR